jgi:hypothetical protein
MVETVGMVLDRIEQKANPVLHLKPDANSLEFLQACYRNPAINLQIRIRCAVACLQYEHPRLAVVAQISEQSFAEVLERRLKKLRDMEQNPPMIEAPKPQPIDVKPQPVDVRPSMPRLSDRKYRRM